ncbi:MAG: phycobilisome rod-core linker polypeptide [Elainellaceae cyanobacterium]
MHSFNPITVNRHSTIDDRKAALYRIYQQVLERQPNAFERKKLSRLEGDFLKNKVGVRRFLKEIGHSELYLDAFYYRSSNQKFLENCIKHFLGRTLVNGEEMHTYCDLLMRSGVTALINGILDSEEYRKHFGCFTVPYHRDETCYESPKAFLESNVVCEEHYGRRGWSVPTLYWHQLGLNCDEGVCTPVDSPSITAEPVPVAAQTQTPLPQPVAASVASSQAASSPAAVSADADSDDLANLLWGVQ